MIKKITAALLAALFCLCAVGCSKTDPDAPEGMKSATVEGEPFVLYVPESWTLNTASGISGAYYAPVDGLSVSARYTTSATDKTEYLKTCAAAYEAEYAESGFVLIENEQTAATLGGKDAARISYEFKNGDTVIRVTQICASSDGMLISLYIYCPKAELEARAEQIEEIRAAFKIVGKTAQKAEAVTTKDTPDGMKLASSNKIEYRFFVPMTWSCDPESGASEATYPESGSSSVTVTSFVPDSSMSIDDYFLSCEEKYKTELEGYERVGESTERKVDGRAARSYTFKTTAEGREIKIMQTIFIYDSSFYTVTYTALTENFDTHMADVEQMLGAFKFR